MKRTVRMTRKRRIKKIKSEAGADGLSRIFLFTSAFLDFFLYTLYTLA